MIEKESLLQELYELLDENNNLMEIPSEELLSRAFVYIDKRFRKEDFDDATEVTAILSTIIKGLIERLKEIHDILDNLNGEKGNYCFFCDADSYNGKDGIEHKDGCIILKLREWMKGD